jgi:hypothetical protein
VILIRRVKTERILRLLILLTVAVVCLAQSGLPPELVQLAHIKRKMQSHLARITNLSCLETIERFSTDDRGVNRKRDTLLLEVAFVQGRELYAGIGAGRFEDSSIGAFSRGGAVDSGLFASHAGNVFGQQGPAFRYRGEEAVGEREAVRYDFEVPLQASGYQMNVGGVRAAVPYSGSFWADPKTLDVLRLTVRAEKIPPHLRVAEAVQEIDYERVVIGGADLVLPERAETFVRNRSGQRNENRIQFSHWLQYIGESSLVLEEPDPSAKSEPDPGPLRLPAGLTLSLQLAAEVDLAKARRGDLVSATVDQDARWRGEMVAPRGSEVRGRIRSIDRPDGSDGEWRLGLEFSELAAGGRRARFFCRLEEVKSRDGVRKLGEAGVPGVGMLRVRKDHPRIGRELRMVWKMEEF